MANPYFGVQIIKKDTFFDDSVYETSFFGTELEAFSFYEETFSLTKKSLFFGTLKVKIFCISKIFNTSVVLFNEIFRNVEYVDIYKFNAYIENFEKEKES